MLEYTVINIALIKLQNNMVVTFGYISIRLKLRKLTEKSHKLKTR